MAKYKVGDKVIVKGDEVLGTCELEMEIFSIESFGYYVTDECGGYGPVNFDLEPLQVNCY